MTVNSVPNVPFAQIANAMLRDKRLSYKARGLLAMVLSNIGEWEAPRDWLMEQSDKDGRESVQSALNELTALGYRRTAKVQGAGGLFSTQVEWTHDPNQWVDRPTGNPTAGETDRPETRPSTEHHPEHQSLPDGRDVGRSTVGSQNAERLCVLLADHIERNGSKRPAITKQWLDAARLLIDRDERTPDQVERAIRWCQDDEFWRGNIESMPTLRRQYDRLRLAAERERPRHAAAVRGGVDLVARLEAEHAQDRPMLELGA